MDVISELLGCYQSSMLLTILKEKKLLERFNDKELQKAN